mmetsp:Transcript_9357/g.10223  ORF Transcript_9357/g.10223 Transcript_9357/m.10223 type:complete len:135 (-) Transcript_9357:902-1306(-)
MSGFSMYANTRATLGTTRNITHHYKKMRNDYLNSRSKVSVNSGSARTLNGPLLSSSQPKSDSPTDYSQSRLPPKWVDVYEEIKDKIKEVEEKITEIEGLYKRKLKVFLYSPVLEKTIGKLFSSAPTYPSKIQRD